MILLNAHQLEKSYGDRRLFTGLSLGISSEDRIGLLGPNGSGKSTLVRILAGLIEPDDGQVSRKKGLKIGFLEQSPSFSAEAQVLSTLYGPGGDEGEAYALAWEWMAKLELTRFGEDFLVRELSGGWQKRVALGCELVKQPDLLILDEPTNHLDTSTLLWLEEFLVNARIPLLMVTHDRLFLQRVCNQIWDLDPRLPQGLLCAKGDYAQYLESKELELAAQLRHEQVEKNRLRRETEWLRRGSIARQTKQSARKAAAGVLKDTVQELGARNQERLVDLSFGTADKNPKLLIELKGAAKAYGDKKIFSGLDLLITPKTRLGILGDNGSGKSTLIRALIGSEALDQGARKAAQDLAIAYFEQGRETLNLDWSVLRNVCDQGDYVSFQGSMLHVRSYLDRFYFSGSRVDVPVKKLSGGEQARLRLAQLMLKSAQVLILDEPTNDLDVGMLESLEDSLRSFNGAVILVSHDRYFLDSVCSDILAFPPDGRPDVGLQKFAGYLQWENWFLESGRRGDEPAIDEAATAKTSMSVPAKPKKLSYKEKFELDNMQSDIEKLESQLAELELKAADPEVMQDRHLSASVALEMANLSAQIEAKYKRWAELS